MTKREALKKIVAAMVRANGEVAGHAGGGRIAAGLASEGYSGGYVQALRDVELLLRSGVTPNTRHYWS